MPTPGTLIVHRQSWLLAARYWLGQAAAARLARDRAAWRERYARAIACRVQAQRSPRGEGR